MKAIIRFFTTAVLTLAAPLAALAQENDTSIHFTPKEGGIKQHQTFTIIFPDAMVGPEAVGKETKDSPIEFEPKVKGTFRWNSQTEGAFNITDQVIPGTKYGAGIRKGTKALDGRKLRKDAISGSYESAALTVTPKYRSWRNRLPAAPSVRLLFNYPVDFKSAAQAIYFQDRVTRERFQAALLIPSVTTKADDPSPESPASGSDVTVEPEAPLPVGRKIDLIIDGLRDAATNTPIPFLKSFPLGETNPLQVESIKAFGSAKFEPTISIVLSSDVDLDTVTEATISVSPEVPNLRRLADSRSINLQGDFDLTTDYTVTVSPPLSSETGYGLNDPFAKTLSFGGYNPEIWFPSQMFFQRSALGLNVKFLHSNTRQVFWKLASIPDHKIAIISSRLSNEKELAIDSLGLKTVAGGELPGTSTIEAAYRDIVWKPGEGEPMLSGAYLLEVNTPLRSGKLAGHRAMIFFNDLTVTQKRSPYEVGFKIMRMSDATPVAGAKVRVVRNDNELMTSGETDADGYVKFSPSTLFPQKQENAHHLLIDTPNDGRAIQFVSVPHFSNSSRYYSSHEVNLRGALITDRNLYRPGTTVKVKGIVRTYSDGGRKENDPKPLANHQVNWSIRESSGKVVKSGSTNTDEYGGWEAEYETSKDQKLGRYSVYALATGFDRSAGSNYFRVEEYRTPLFNVNVTDDSKPGAAGTRIRIQSNYFHGSPNAGARLEWSIDWGTSQIIWDGHERDDDYSENPRSEPNLKSASGEVRLDANGSAVLEFPSPLPLPLYSAGLSYSVSIDVTSPEGRTISTGLYESRSVIPLMAGIDAEPVYKENETTMIDVDLRANEPEKYELVADVPMTVEMYHVVSQTVKEKIAPGVYRYRNFDRFDISAVEKGFTGKILSLPASNPGRYVVVASLDGNSDAPRVSKRVTVAADAPAQYPVQTSTTFSLVPDKKSYRVGETAVLASESPFAGKAWVTIETNSIHEQFIVDVPENASEIKIPVKAEYHPNIYVTAYLVQPGGADHLPVERFGRTLLTVDRPELELKVEPTLAQEEVEPGKPVNGTVLVTCEGKPLANADITLMAVDEAVLKLGDWRLPDLLYAFYPHRSHRMGTYQALHNHFEDFEDSDMVEKGFLIGGGGAGGGFSQQKMRKNFLARAFWKTQLRTDAKGMVSFDFNAPDNLTAFRVTALAATKESQFGHGKATLRVAKRLMAEPALPRFVRVGDKLELRVVVRQTAMEKGMVLVKCQTEGGIKLTGKAAADPMELADGIPQVFRFPAEITSTEPVVVRFAAEMDGNSDIGDAVETKLPVYLPGILQSTGRYGEIPAGVKEFKLADKVPNFWQETTGSFNLTLSYNPWLPKLTGLPNILEYPHGCLEQKSTRYLGYTVLADLLAFLPDLQGRHENYKQRIGEGMQLYEKNMKNGKFLPYWPGGHQPNYYVTCLAAWVTHNANKAGVPVSDTLKDGFGGALDDIIRGRVDHVTHDTRCFALFVHSEMTKEFKKPNAHADVMKDLYLHRDRGNDESRSLLAIAMMNFGVLEQEKTQLIREINMPLNERAFDPACFYSTTRAEAMRFVAQSRAGGEAWEKGADVARERLLTMMDSSYGLSTQENLWLLIAFKELHDRKEFAQFDPEKVQPSAEQVSMNKSSIAWKTRGLEKLKDMAVSFENAEPAYYLVDAQVMRSGENMEREDRGIRIERVVRNLTDENRLGTKDAPFKLGDEVLINYRMSVKNVQHYTALVDELPAALETLNPNLAQVAQFYTLPEEFANPTLYLDHSELRDQAANLYFDLVKPGQHSYSILGRITSVGQFTWPSAAITPMYETRFGGLSAPNECYVTE